MARILLVGGGHAMLPFLKHAKPLTEAGASITLLDSCEHLWYSGMTPEFLGGVYSRDEIRINLQKLCEASGVTFLKETVTQLHTESKTIRTLSGKTFSFDLIAFDIGAKNPDLPHADMVIPTKPLFHIEELEELLKGDILKDKKQNFHLAIVGGGAAGTEIAFNISARCKRFLKEKKFKLTIIEPSERILQEFPEGMSYKAEKLLKKRGVDIRLNSSVGNIRNGKRDDSDFFADAILWATGSTGRDIFKNAGLSCDEKDFIKVKSSLHSIDVPWLFAAGDCASVEGFEKLAKAGIHAVKEGEVLKENLFKSAHHLLKNEPLDSAVFKNFRPYPLAPLILSSGTPKAFWSAGNIWFYGRSFLLLKHFIDKRWVRKYRV